MIPIDYVIVTRRSATVPFVIIIIVWFNYRIGWQFPAITPISRPSRSSFIPFSISLSIPFFLQTDSWKYH